MERRTGKREEQVRNDNHGSVFGEELPLSLLDYFGW